MAVNFGPWRPDVGGPGSGMAQVAEGVIPQAGASGLGYGPFPQLVVASGAASLSGEPRGGIAIQQFDNTWVQYFATDSTIEELQTDYSWSVIEAGRTVQPGDDVIFCHFGRYLLNTDLLDGMKAYDVESGGTNDAIAAAPVARFIFTCSNAVFALDCDGNNRRIQSSDIGSHTVWEGGAAEGKTFEDGGALICGSDLKNGAAIVMQERCLRLIQFGSGAGVYSITKIADGRGCVGARTLASFDGIAFWWDTDGPWMYSSGGLEPIGAEKLNRWAKETIGQENYKNLQAAIDPARSLVLWRIDGSIVLVYNWLLKEWSTLPVLSGALSRLATAAISIDSVSDPIDGVDDPIDSPIWAGSAPQLGALDTNFRFATFAGPNMAATLETCENATGLTGLITWVTPVDDAALGTLQVGVTDSLSASVNWKAGQSKVTSGRVPARARGKIAAYRRNILAGDDWSFANGVDNIVVSQGGPR